MRSIRERAVRGSFMPWCHRMPGHHGDDEEDDRENREQIADLRRHSRDSAQAENGGHERNDEERHGPAEHGASYGSVAATRAADCPNGESCH